MLHMPRWRRHGKQDPALAQAQACQIGTSNTRAESPGSFTCWLVAASSNASTWRLFLWAIPMFLQAHDNKFIVYILLWLSICFHDTFVSVRESACWLRRCTCAITCRVIRWRCVALLYVRNRQGWCIAKSRLVLRGMGPCVTRASV